MTCLAHHVPKSMPLVVLIESTVGQPAWREAVEGVAGILAGGETAVDVIQGGEHCLVKRGIKIGA